MLQKKHKRGVTILEIVIVIAILALLFAFIIPSFSSFRRNSLLNGEAMNLVALINRARLLSVSSKNDDQYGVHLESTKAVLFKGSSYVEGSSGNETHTFGNGLTLSDVTISGGGANILFEKVTGATSQNATTTLLVTNTTASTTILVLPTGIATLK